MPTVNWPAENTAFLVIHGNGPHREYQILDKFASKFYQVLKDDGVALKDPEHKLDDRTRSYVRFTSPDQKPYIDFYEYYWDCFMVRDITDKELNDWLTKLDNGVDAFKEEKLIPSNYNPPLFKLFRGCIPWLRILLWMRNCLPEVVSARILKSIIGYATDTAIFCLQDQRSSYYEIREKVLSNAVRELIALLNSGEHYERIIVVGHSLGAVIAHDAFCRIARDLSAPRQLLGITNTSVQKIKGWVTFGSFLDVVAFFFQAHVLGPDKPRGIKDWLAKIKRCVPFSSFLDVVALFFKEHVLSHIKRVCPCLFRKKGTVPAPQISMEKQITGQRHAFKEKLPPYGQNPVDYNLLQNVKWLNFYHPDDFISNCKLIAYKLDHGDAQVKRDTPIKAGCCKSLLYKIPGIKLFTKSMAAHGSYWEDNEMYLKIARKFFE